MRCLALTVLELCKSNCKIMYRYLKKTSIFVICTDSKQSTKYMYRYIYIDSKKYAPDIWLYWDYPVWCLSIFLDFFALTVRQRLCLQYTMNSQMATTEILVQNASKLVKGCLTHLSLR